MEVQRDGEAVTEWLTGGQRGDVRDRAPPDLLRGHPQMVTRRRRSGERFSVFNFPVDKGGRHAKLNPSVN
ncbi:hypothetical protein JCM9533A_24020 [Catenuloplanes niger JCM 9533]